MREATRYIVQACFCCMRLEDEEEESRRRGKNSYSAHDDKHRLNDKL